jgi:hypothetical protein
VNKKFTMATMLFTLTDALAERVKTKIAAGERSALVSKLLEEELERRDRALYKCAMEVEQDETLRTEMADWSITSADGLR